SRILAGHRGVWLLAAGRFLRPCRLHRRCSAPLPYAAGPGSRTGLDLRFLVAGPGFEPGKTVAGGFTSLEKGAGVRGLAGPVLRYFRAGVGHAGRRAGVRAARPGRATWRPVL